MGIFQVNNYIIYLVKQTKWLLIITVISTGISIGLNFILIPYLGLTGAAISKIAAFFVLAAIVTIWVRKSINYNINFRFLGKIIVASLLMAACLYFLKIDGITGIVLSVLIGSAVFAVSMFFMKAFTQQDKQLIRNTFTRLLTWIR